MNRTYEVKPIPTEYRGVKYKSRLEARWAVFFDYFGVEHFYEYEGYQLPSGWYVPDFYVPSMETWFEVKPSEFTPIEERLCWELEDATKKRIVQLSGDMRYRKQGDNDGFDVLGDSDYYFCICPHCGKLGIEFDGRGARVCGERCLPGQDKGYSSDYPSLIDAFNRAAKWQFR